MTRLEKLERARFLVRTSSEPMNGRFSIAYEVARLVRGRKGIQGLISGAIMGSTSMAMECAAKLFPTEPVVVTSGFCGGVIVKIGGRGPAGHYTEALAIVLAVLECMISDEKERAK